MRKIDINKYVLTIRREITQIIPHRLCLILCSLFFVVIFAGASSPAQAEINSKDYLSILNQSLQKNDMDRIHKLVSENPQTTQTLIQILEEDAKQTTTNEETAKNYRGIAALLREVRDSQNNKESQQSKDTSLQDEEHNKGAKLFAEAQKLFAVSDFRGALGQWEEALAIFKKLQEKQSISETLAKIGLAYFNLGDYHKAIAFYEQSLAIAEELGNKNNKGQRLGNLGSANLSLGDYAKAIDFYEKALSIAEETGDKESKAITIGNLGLANENLGDFRKSIAYYEQAMTLFEELGNKMGRETALGNLGIDYAKLGDYRKAISFYEQALALSKEIGDRQGESLALGNLGITYDNLGDYRKAIGYHEQALAIASEIGDRQSKGKILSNLGLAYSSMGDYHKAIGFYEQAILQDKEIDVSYVTPEGNLGDAYLALDRDEEAFAIYTKHDHVVRLGRYYLKKKDFVLAKEQFNRNREEYEEAKKTTIILPQWIGLGIANENLKQYAEAYKWYKKAITFMEDQRDRLTPAEREFYFEGKVFNFPRIEAYEGAVRCSFMLNRNDEAFYWAENTRGRLLSELLSKRHSGENYKIPGNIAAQEEDLNNKIMINKTQQQTAFEKNNPELLKRLEAQYPVLRAKMDGLIDRLRKEYPQYASIKYPQPVKLSQLTLKKSEIIIEYEVTDPYTIGLVIRDGKVIEAFKVDKTRTELEAMVKKYRSPFQEGADIKSFNLNLARELTDLLIKPAMPFLQKGEHLIIIPDESLSLLPFEALLLAAPAETLKEEAILLNQAAKQTGSDTMDKAAVIRGLTKAMVTRSGVKVAPRVTMHILFDTGLAQIKGESQKQLREMAAALAAKELKNATIQIEGHTDSVGDSKFNIKLSLKRAQAVYNQLVKSGISPDRLIYTGKGDSEPIADNKDEKGRKQNRRVDFVRMDSFGSASAASSGSQMKDFVYAMDEYSISYYQSASVLSLQRGLHISRTKEQTFFGLGDPVFDVKDSRAADKRSIKIVAKQTGISSKDIADNEETKNAGYEFGRLVNTAKEVKEVGKLFGKSEMLLLGIEASEENLKKKDLSSRKYLLFSTHGILGNEIPYIKQPALVLSLVGNDKEDGFLTASEIFNLSLNADLVGLSACKTGLGVQSAGEGIVGLSRAFMYAGTDTVLVSLWSVADESTYKLMVKFFDELKSGKDKITALQDAKQYLRSHGYDNLFYWAPFILIGETN